MSESHLVFVGIAPHPPVMVPEVGGAMADEVRASIEAMRDLAGRVKACGAETVVLISPHAPLEERAFVAYDGPPDAAPEAHVVFVREKAIAEGDDATDPAVAQQEVERDGCAVV